MLPALAVQLQKSRMYARTKSPFVAGVAVAVLPMHAPLSVVRATALALCLILYSTGEVSSEALFSERDFVLLAPQAPFKFIDLPEPYASAGELEANNDWLYPTPSPPHVLDMGVHPPLFMAAPLPDHPDFLGQAKAEEKWRAIASAKITSQLCLQPVSSTGEQLAVLLHSDDPSLFYVHPSVSEAAAQRAASFDLTSDKTLCFEEVVMFFNGNGQANGCRRRAGLTPPNTCYEMLPIPPQFSLQFDERYQAQWPHIQQRLHSRLLYSATVEVTITIAAAGGEPTIIELVSPPFFTAFRQRIEFAYLVQAETSFATSHLETQRSVALVTHWRQNATAPNSFYLPNSTQNQGRNELYRQVHTRHPGVAFRYFIFMDEDLELLIRTSDLYPSAEFVPAYNSTTAVLINDPMAYRLFERYLLEYEPAIGVPWHRNWACGDDDEVQLINHFDHIIVAVHTDFARFILPTETRFDDLCWWFGQQIWALNARFFAHQHRLQFNAVESRNAGSRTEDVQGAALYLKRHDFYHSITWFMSSVRNTTLLDTIELDIEAKKWFWYGGMKGRINTRIGAQDVLRAPARGYPPDIIHPDNIDCCHPYWQTHRLELLTPNAAWHRQNWPWTGGMQVLNCSMMLHPSIQCGASYAPDAATHFRLFWLNQRMLQAMQNKLDAQEQRLQRLEQLVAGLSGDGQCNSSAL